MLIINKTESDYTSDGYIGIKPWINNLDEVEMNFMY